MVIKCESIFSICKQCYTTSTCGLKCLPSRHFLINSNEIQSTFQDNIDMKNEMLTIYARTTSVLLTEAAFETLEMELICRDVIDIEITLKVQANDQGLL